MHRKTSGTRAGSPTRHSRASKTEGKQMNDEKKLPASIEAEIAKEKDPLVRGMTRSYVMRIMEDARKNGLSSADVLRKYGPKN